MLFLKNDKILRESMLQVLKHHYFSKKWKNFTFIHKI